VQFVPNITNVFISLLHEPFRQHVYIIKKGRFVDIERVSIHTMQFRLRSTKRNYNDRAVICMKNHWSVITLLHTTSSFV